MKVIEKHKKGFKKTKLGWIPDDWEVSTIKNVFDYLKTNSFSRSQLINQALNENNIYNIHYGDIHSSFKYEILNVAEVLALPKVIDKELISLKADYLKDGDLIMADASEDYEGLCDCVELENVNKIKLVSGLHTFALRDRDNNFINGFKPYLFKSKSVVKSLYRIATGISVLGVSKSNLDKVLIPIPPLPEQQKIATILSDWDTTIEKVQILINILQLRKKGLMQQLLTGKTRLAGFSGEWQEKELEYFIEYTSRPKIKPKDLYLVLGLRSHGKGIFHKENFDPSSIAMDTLYEVKENDLVVNITFAWEHAIAIANKEDEGGLVSHRFPTYTFKNDISDAKFFRYYILQSRFKYLLGVISPGGAGRNRVMSKKDFPKLMIKAPSFEEQKAIGNILNSADQEIKHYQNYVDQIQTQKKGLMQQLLTGNIRVKV